MTPRVKIEHGRLADAWRKLTLSLSQFPALGIWASYQIHKIAGYACAGNARNVFPWSTSKETAS